MAKKPPPAKEQDNSTDDKKSGKGCSIFLIIFVLIFLLILAGGAFAAGVYLKFIDIDQLALNHKLYDYPVIGQYFQRPVTNFEKVPLKPDHLKLSPTTVSVKPPVVTPVAVTPSPEGSEKEKLLAQAKERNKQLSKLARLYGGMKPAEAVAVLNLLDDDTVIGILNKMDEDQVSKILALFSPERTARLSQSMLKGKIVSL
jgi:flagellar protein FlbB